LTQGRRTVLDVEHRPGLAQADGFTLAER